MGDRVLIDDTGLEWYTVDRKVRVDTPFYAAYEGKEGIDAARAAVRDQAYDAVVLTGGITGEGRALYNGVVPEIYPAGYVRIYVPPDSPPVAGLFVPPRNAQRYRDAPEQAEALYRRIEKERRNEAP
jgi:hypothetical protein